MQLSKGLTKQLPYRGNGLERAWRSYFLRALLLDVLLVELLLLDFFFDERPELTDLPLRPSLLSCPASISCS